MTDKLLAEREKTHGNYSNMAAKAQAIKKAVFEGAGRCSDLNAAQRESIEMIATKLARICSGDPNVRDHWDDIAGYAKLVSSRISVAPRVPGAFPPAALPK